MNADETTTGWLSFARAHAEGSALDPAGWELLEGEAARLGLFGLVAAGALRECPEPDPALAAELSDAFAARLAEEGCGAGPLAERIAAYRAAKGAAAPELLGRLLARELYEVYGLRAHGFLSEDALLAGQLLAAGRPSACAREAARRLARLSRTGARTLLGHLDGQLELVHRLAQPEAVVAAAEVDRRLAEFAPRIFAQRWPSMVKRLLLDDKAFRFVVVLWARLRGVALGRQALAELAARIEPARPMLFVQALEEARRARATLAAAPAGAGALCEELFAAARPLPPL